VRTYFTYPENKSTQNAIVIFTDILGIDFINVQLYVLLRSSVPFESELTFVLASPTNLQPTATSPWSPTSSTAMSFPRIRPLISMS